MKNFFRKSDDPCIVYKKFGILALIAVLFIPLVSVVTMVNLFFFTSELWVLVAECACKEENNTNLTSLAWLRQTELGRGAQRRRLTIDPPQRKRQVRQTHKSLADGLQWPEREPSYVWSSSNSNRCRWAAAAATVATAYPWQQHRQTSAAIAITVRR